MSYLEIEFRRLKGLSDSKYIYLYIQGVISVKSVCFSDHNSGNPWTDMSKILIYIYYVLCRVCLQVTTLKHPWSRSWSKLVDSNTPANYRGCSRYNLFIDWLVVWLIDLVDCLIDREFEYASKLQRMIDDWLTDYFFYFK